jgi:hypothetical protein
MQKITHLQTFLRKDILIEPVTAEDFKIITKAKYFFDWNAEKRNGVYKLRLNDSEEILGLISLENYESEDRLQINLLAVSKENRGAEKIYDGIAENLIVFACRLAVKLYAENACVSLIPKTELKIHYIHKYGMIDAGKQIFLEGMALYKLIERNENG